MRVRTFAKRLFVFINLLSFFYCTLAVLFLTHKCGILTFSKSFTEVIASTTSVIWIADSRSPSSTVCKLNHIPYNWYLMCCFCAKHAALRRKIKDRLARNQDNVSEWDNMSIHRLLFQWANTIKMQLNGHHLIEN